MGYLSDDYFRVIQERPRLDIKPRRGGRWLVVLTDRIGAHWRVTDYIVPASAGDRWQRCPATPSSCATARVFRHRDGTIRCYRFHRGERRDLNPREPERIVRQFELAELLVAGTASRDLSPQP